MKILKVFSLFILLQVAAWAGTHVYQNQHRATVLVVVDTSYAMKPKFPQVQTWLEDFEQKARYRDIVVGTDKALLGPLTDLKSKSVIFRTAFGSINSDSLTRYDGFKAKQKILLSDGNFIPAGWDVIQFD